MANTHKYFDEFNSIIRLTDKRKSDLRSSRTSLRDKIKKWFSENHSDYKPKFNGQGSFMMDTIINPIPEKDKDGNILLKYDLDDGIYLIGDLAVEDRPATSTIHSWIVKAVEGHTNTKPIDKNTCIRTIFSTGRHIDNPVYYRLEGQTPELAHKTKGYIKSDPKAFTEWFNKLAKDQPQIRRIVRIVKAWSNYHSNVNSSQKFPSGMILTILIANNFYEKDKRDDIALKETLLLIYQSLSVKFECYRPTVPTNEDLLADYTQSDFFLKKLKVFIDDLTLALKNPNFKNACEHIQKHLGDRFPNGEDKCESNNVGGLGSLILPTTKPFGY